MGNEVSSSSRSRSQSPRSARSGSSRRLAMDDGILFFDNLCGTTVADYANDAMDRMKKNERSSSSKSRGKSSSRSYDDRTGSAKRDNADDDNRDNDRRSKNSGRRPRTSYDDDTASEMGASEADENTINDDYDTDADTMVTDCTEPLGPVSPLPAAHHSAKPLASSFAKKCYFTKAGIGKNTQHYEGLVTNGTSLLMLATAMKLKGCPTICDEDLRRVEKTFPNQFSRLPDELMLSSGWRRISKYCHFSNKPIPDGIPFFHSKEKLHPNGGYYFLLASAIGMISPSDVEPLSRDHLVVLETDYPTQCDSAPLQLIQNPNHWTLVQKFCFFSGGPINTDEDVYYEADFVDRTIYMLAFLSPALTPEELYLLDGSKAEDQNHPVRMSVDAVRDVEAVYDLMERDFEDLKLYHLGPCRALPIHLLQPKAWRKVLPSHFCFVRDRAMERAKAFEERYGKIKYAPFNPVPAQDNIVRPTAVADNAYGPLNSNINSFQEHAPPQERGLPPSNHMHSNVYPPQSHLQIPFYNTAAAGQHQLLHNEGSPYQAQPYIMPHDDTRNEHHARPSYNADLYPRPHDEAEGMDLQQEVDRKDHSSKVSVISFGGDVDVEAGPTLIVSNTTNHQEAETSRVPLETPDVSAVSSKPLSASIPSPRVNEQHVPYKSTATEENEMNRNDAMDTKEYKLGALQSQNKYNSSQTPTLNNQWANSHEDEGRLRRNDHEGGSKDETKLYRDKSAKKAAKTKDYKNTMKQSQFSYEEDESNESEERSDARSRPISQGNKTMPEEDNDVVKSKKHDIIPKVSSFQNTRKQNLMNYSDDQSIQSEEIDRPTGNGTNKMRQDELEVMKSSVRRHMKGDVIPKATSSYSKEQNTPCNEGERSYRDRPHVIKKQTTTKSEEMENNGSKSAPLLNGEADGSRGEMKKNRQNNFPDLNNKRSITKNDRNYDDVVLGEVDSTQNDENDETRLHGYGNRKDRTMLEDEYSVGRQQVSRVRANMDRDIKDDETVGSRSRSGHNASLSSRLRHPQEQTPTSKSASSRVLSTMNYDSVSTRSPSPKLPFSNENDDLPIISKSYSKPLNESKQVSTSTQSSSLIRTPSPKQSFSPEHDDLSSTGKTSTKPLYESKHAFSRLSISDDSSSAITPTKNAPLPKEVSTESPPNDSPSPTHSVSTSEDKNSRRALILKMAKARMQKHKRDLSEPPVSGRKDSMMDKSQSTSKFNLDLD